MTEEVTYRLHQLQQARVDLRRACQQLRDDLTSVIRQLDDVDAPVISRIGEVGDKGTLVDVFAAVFAERLSELQRSEAAAKQLVGANS